jgi:hypothetical protein
MTTPAGTSTDLIALPGTGEVIDLRNATDQQLAEVRTDLIELGRQRNTAAGQIDDELVRRADAAFRNGDHDSHTWTAGDYKIAVDVKHPTRIDAGGLRAALLRLVDDGAVNFTEARVRQTFIPTYKLHLERWASLVKLDPELEQLRADHATLLRRGVTITQFRPAAIDATAEDEEDPQ